MTISKRTFIIAAVVVLVVLVAVGVAIGARFASSGSGSGEQESDYTAVYLTTGDLYFGKISWWPKPHLKDVWILNRDTSAEAASQLSVVPFKGVVWGPSDDLYLNPKEIIWWTRLRSDSQIVKAVEGAKTTTVVEGAKTTTSEVVGGDE